MSNACPKPGCTFGDTGVGFLNYSRPEECPVLSGSEEPDFDEGPEGGADEDGAGANDQAPADAGASHVAPAVADLTPPAPTKTRLRPGRELGLDGLQRLAARRPVRIIGLLGAPDAGKTMALVSIFLLAGRGRLGGYGYRNSESAFAFDELSAGLRAWTPDGGMLDQLVPHTELADERRPGFLHLRLHSSAIGAAVDLAFPDLPGEWTETLVNENVYKRLAFLRNAETIWLFVDGSRLANLNFGHGVCDRTRSLIGRLAANLPVKVPLKLVVTRADQFEEIPDVILDPIVREAADKGFAMEVHKIISVDRAGLDRSGEGIQALLDSSVTATAFGAAPSRPDVMARRSMLRYKSETAA